MATLKPLAWRDLIERLRERGFEGPYSGGGTGLHWDEDIDVAGLLASDKRSRPAACRFFE